MRSVDDVSRLDPTPAGRTCSACGGPLRRSHLVYVGGGESVAVDVCRGCGRAFRGPTSEGVSAASRSPRRSRRPLPDEGPPDNPVIDPALAERLRRRFGTTNAH